MPLDRIIRALEKALDRLGKFQEQNAGEIAALKNELHLKERQQERARQVATKIAEIYQ